MELIEGGSLDAAIRCRSRILSPSNLHLSAVPLSQTSISHSSSKQEQEQEEEDSEDPNADDDLRALARSRDDYRHLARLVAGVADGLDHAHRCGVIHRDLKPHNLLVGKDSRLQITDFGLARLLDEPGLTLSGEVMGTPAYLSPEQIQPDEGPIDCRTDIYSLGVTLYELLTLRRPFEGRTREQIMTGIRVGRPRQPRQADPRLPRELETICLKAMSRSVADRYQSAEEVADDLRRFADGRPIRSRPPGPLVRAGKWVRRHKAVTTAIVCLAVAVLLGAGLITSVRSARHRQAEQLVHDVYNRMVFLDFRPEEGTAATLAEAEKLGGDQRRIGLLRGLAALDASDWTGAIDRFAPLAEADPTDAKAAYLLAWAYERNHDQDSADAWLARGDAIEPTSAEAWFFRGMALHYDKPLASIASYHQARQIRARDGEPYLQATLHLAQAYNQHMYAARNIDDFSEAEDALEQLIEYEMYGAYPYYLLSIAHRLAAEIYAGSLGTRDDRNVDHHYQLSLAMARAGQERSRPGYARPIAAEAVCLESMGEFEQARQARTRQIETSNKPYTQCEGYHYRWRLDYWAGRWEEALADIQRHRECPQDDHIFYDHFYPALVLAEMGEMERAIAEVEAIAKDTDSALAVIWAAAGLRMLGLAAEADELLLTRADDVDFTVGLVPPQTPQWVEDLYALVSGQVAIEELLKESENIDQPWKLHGEAHFHEAMLKLGLGDREAAHEGFQTAFRSYDNEMRYTFHAKILWVKLGQKRTWPAWINEGALELDGSDGVQNE